MKKTKWMAWLLMGVLLLSGCAEEETETHMDQVFITTQSALEGGHFFFSGKVLGVSTEERLISYYEAEMGKNTFYSVEVTEDYYQCMPDRNITVCVLGSGETFRREGLKKDREYIFDTTLWVEGDQTIFLLPTFHSYMPELQNGEVYIPVDGEAVSCGSYEEYREQFDALAAKAKYCPQTVLDAVKLALQGAAERVDPALFKKMGYKNVDAALLKKTGETAASLLEKAQKIEPTWEEIGELIQ